MQTSELKNIAQGPAKHSPAPGRSRKGSFAKQMLPSEYFNSVNSKKFSQFAEDTWQLYQNQEFTGAELCARYLHFFLHETRRKDWKGGRLKIINENHLPQNSYLAKLIPFSLRGIPQAVNQTLEKWHLGQWYLKLESAVPSAFAVLKMQSEGFRCVSAPTVLSPNIESGRDTLSFLLHDLVHAYHFFSDPSQMQEQIQFANWLQDVYQQEILKEPLLDPLFQKDFEYLCADMNSHVSHLMEYFKAILITYQLRSEGRGPRETLSIRGQEKVKEIQDCLATLKRPA